MVFDSKCKYVNIISTTPYLSFYMIGNMVNNSTQHTLLRYILHTVNWIRTWFLVKTLKCKGSNNRLFTINMFMNILLGMKTQEVLVVQLILFCNLFYTSKTMIC